MRGGGSWWPHTSAKAQPSVNTLLMDAMLGPMVSALSDSLMSYLSLPHHDTLALPTLLPLLFFLLPPSTNQRVGRYYGHLQTLVSMIVLHFIRYVSLFV